MCFLSINEASTINSVINVLNALSFVDDPVDDVDLAPNDLQELLDFDEDLDESFLFSSFSLTQF